MNLGQFRPANRYPRKKKRPLLVMIRALSGQPYQKRHSEAPVARSEVATMMRRSSFILPVLVVTVLAFPPGMQAQSGSNNAASKTIWAHVQLNSQRIGFYHESTQRTADRVISATDLEYALGREGSQVEIKSHAVYVQTLDGHLLSVHSESSSSKTPTTIDAIVSGQSVDIRSASGGKSYESTLSFAGELLGPEGARRLTVADLDCSKRAFSYQTFMPDFVTIKTLTTTCAGPEQIDAPAKLLAHKFTQAIEDFPLQQTLWADGAGQLLRLETATPFGKMITARTDSDPRNSPAQAHARPSSDMYGSTLVSANVLIPDARRVQEMTIRITQKKPELGWPDFSSPEQTVLEKTSDHVVLRVRQASLPSSTEKATMPPADLASYLSANSLLQADDDQVKKEAEEATRGHAAGLDSALALQEWTAANMHFDMGIAVIPASEVARDRHGTCVGYAILLASLARADHIPSRIRMGYVYDHGIWGGHAWTELYVNGNWLPLDAAEYYPGPSDAARFSAIVTGALNGTIENLGDFAKITGSIEVRILDFTIAGQKVNVPADAQPFRIVSNSYENPWLGLRLNKPASMTFFDTDSHWPDDTLVGIRGGGDSLKVRYGSLDADKDWQAQAKSDLVRHGVSGDLLPASWHGMEWMRRAFQQLARRPLPLPTATRRGIWLRPALTRNACCETSAQACASMMLPAGAVSPPHPWRHRFIRSVDRGQVNAKDNNADRNFARIIEEYAPAFARLAAAYEQDLALREDLLQEIMFAVWRALPSFRGESSERTFLYRIAHNRALTHISKRRYVSAELGEAEDMPDAGPGPDEVIRSAQLRVHLQNAIAELPLPLKQVCVLALDGLSNTQIAEIVGTTENNVRVRLARARQCLRHLMGAQG